MNRSITLFVLAMLVVDADARGATLKGIVTDSSDQPISGARVDIATATPRHGPGMFCPSCYLDCAKSTFTDSNGGFQIEQLDPSLTFRVLFTATGKKSQLTKQIDPIAGDVKITLVPARDEMPVERTVRGQVVSDLGIPIPGALVWPVGAKTSSRRWYGRVDVEPSVCDANGRFAVLLAQGMRAVDLEVTADGFAGAQATLLTPGAEEYEVKVPTGTRVAGRIVHQGQPVEGLRIAVVQLKRSAEHHFVKAIADTTGVGGRFEFRYLPPNERYAIYTLVGEGGSQRPELVLSTKKFTARDNHETRDLGALDVEPALRLRGRVELPKGQTLPAGTKIVVSRDPAWDLIAIPLTDDGRFDVPGLPPETYELRIAANGFEVDPARLKFQSLGPQSFGILLRESVDDLWIPLLKK